MARRISRTYRINVIDPVHTIAFGPIVSRRFGRSLGVNNIPSKHCSYSCVYCQVGKTDRTETLRQTFFSPAEIVAAVREKVAHCREQGERIDVISFVPDGEPTLDANLGAAILGVKRLGLPVAVITNGSLLWVSEVRRDVGLADIVSVEIDSVDEKIWRRINRPSAALSLRRVQEGLLQFAREYRGALWTQTMLISGVNDAPETLEHIGSFLVDLSPARACLSIPTRPPAESIEPPTDEQVTAAWFAIAARYPEIELVARTADAFVRTGDPALDLLASLTVHPMLESAIARDHASSEAVDQLLRRGFVQRVEYSGRTWLTRTKGNVS